MLNLSLYNGIPTKKEIAISKKATKSAHIIINHNLLDLSILIVLISKQNNPFFIIYIYIKIYVI